MKITSETIVKDLALLNLFGKIKEFHLPHMASGQCYRATEEVLNHYGWASSLEVAFAEHHNDPEGRYFELGQYSNHFALWIPGERVVVDWTLRQFAPRSAWPWVGSYNEWLRILARAWGLSSIKHLTRKRGVLCPVDNEVNCDPYNCSAD